MGFARSGPRAAEFFAGIGLVRLGLEQAGFDVVWANDIQVTKRDLYVENFGGGDFVLADVRDVRGDEIPDVTIATASFPCTDLSLAGNRAGLSGSESSMFWEFSRILDEMDNRRPPVCLLENVPSFATSNGGADLHAAVGELNRLGYICDLLLIDARRFVPQSRPRLFIVGVGEDISDERSHDADWQPTELRPAWIGRFVAAHPDLMFHPRPLRTPIAPVPNLAQIVERLPADDPLWWDREGANAFTSSLSRIQATRLDALKSGSQLSWATAYRRTRHGQAVWEIRADGLSGCLRTARGGSSRQALVEAGAGAFRVRWMTPREYARLQGAPDYKLHNVTTNNALFGLGDAVCVPVVAWLAREYLRPVIEAAERTADVAIA